MKIGNYKISSFISGYFKLDGGIVFGIIPKALWSRTYPADDINRIQLCNRILLLENEERKIIIDTGTGNKLSKKLKEIYDINQNDHSLFGELAKRNIKSDEITDVFLTHLHFDHAGGSTYYNENKELSVSFPNATYYVQKKQYDWATEPVERDRASYFTNDFEPLKKSDRINFIDGNFKYDNFIELITLSGHTRNLMIIKISDGSNTLLHTADLIPMESHLSLPAISAIDSFPLMTLMEKKIFLSSAVLENWMIFLCHDPNTECIRVGFESERFFTKEKIHIE